MRRTPQYQLKFNQTGDLYSASADLERMTITDNELIALSTIVGDGVLEGWTVSSTGGLVVTVAQGKGFISSVLHSTLSNKSLTLIDDATSVIYMRSNMFGTSEGFPISVEGPPSERASASFADTTPPSAPTNLVATAIDFDVINLTWDANSETDINHYELQRDSVTIGTPTSNGTISSPFVDSGLSELTTYSYRVRAVDNSGNESSWSTIVTVTTPQDMTKPTDPKVLQLYPGNTTMGIMFDASRTPDVVRHDLTYYRLNSDGTIAATYPTIPILVPTETYQVTGLTNGYRHRFVIQAVRNNGVTSDGIIKEDTPYSVPAPLDISGLSATAIAAGVQLSWTASASPTGSSIGQKSQYKIYVIDPDWIESAPLTDVGLATTRIVSSYLETADVGFGARIYLEEGKRYGFRVTTVDPFGNESGGFLVRATTLDLTAPTGPRNLNAEPGDSQVALTWTHSTSSDVVGYVLSYGVTTVNLAYVTNYTVGSLTNNVAVTFSLRAKDAAGNSSSAIVATATPAPDTTAPDVPVNTRAEIGDESITYSWAPSAAVDIDHYVVWRRQVFQPVNTPPNLPLTTISGTEIFVTVTSSEMFDIGLTNGSTYAYAVKAIDTSGNESDYSGVTLVSPSEGINSDPRIEAPTSLVATPGVGVVDLAWTFSFPGQYEDPPLSGIWYYPDGGPTDFNVYRSTSQYDGYQFMASVPSSQWYYTDSTVVGSQSGPVTYWYVVTAVRDNASPIADTGGIEPAHSIPLATVVTRSGAIVSVTNEQRIVEGLNATLTEETNKRLLTHKHSVKPTNSTTVTTVGSLTAVDASTLSSLTLSSYDLSDAALAYYNGLKSNTFTVGTSFTIHPSSVVGNVPRVGDFQFLVSGSRPTVSYQIDEANNLIVLSTPQDGTKTFSGKQINFYVPTAIDLGYRGYDVQVDGVTVQDAMVDEPYQVVRMASLVDEQSVVTVIIEPTIPEFGSQQGARQVSLSPNIVLNDFITQNQSTYTSESGAFDDTDTVFALVNGSRTALDYYVDFITKSIVFGAALPSGTQVALEIINREEVQGLLPPTSLVGLDGSQVKTGKLLKAQLPDLSHAGRIKERAWPPFFSAVTTNWYTFPAEVGTGTTPYSFIGLLSGGILMGTSSGLLRSYLSSGILVSATDNLNASSDLLASLPIISSALVDAAEYAAAYKSGRLQGTVNGVLLPSACVLQDGRVLVTGGGVYDALGRMNLGVTSCFIYDPGTDSFSAAGQMSTARIYHTCTLLPSGKVVVTGGKMYPADAYVLDTTPYTNGLAPAWHHASCELYDPSSDTWTTISPMSVARYNHSANLLPDSPYDLVVAGGTTVYNPASPILWDQIPATPTTTGYTDEKYWVKRELSAAERMDLTGFSWSETGALNDASEAVSSVVNGALSFTGYRNREVYDATEGTWSATSASASKVAEARVDVSEPVKQLMIGSDGFIYVVGRNSVYVSSDQGMNYIKMSGLDAVGVVHKIMETSSGTLMAATDIGVYAITPDIRSAMTWFAGGLIGAGTTETFDLIEYDVVTYGAPKVLASTEIGIYETSDDAETWALVVDLEDVRNIEMLGDVLYATAGQAIYRSVDSATWSKISIQSVIDESSTLLARDDLDLLLGTTTGLYWSSDGITFDLVGFDRNRDAERNAVFMLQLSGSDVIVGYEDAIYSLDASYNAIRISEFGGTIPTVRVNGEVARGGYRYDTKNKQVVFEFKRLADVEVEVASSYQVFSLDGGWYHQNPDAPLQVYVGSKTVETGYTYDAWTGKIAFGEPLTKFDPVTASIYGTTLSNEGELLHEEVEDGMELSKGLPLSLGRDHAANVLQMGVDVEHNFLERGVERNQYYCFDTSLVDRSFNSFLKNAEFYILGRRDFDRFNSTIDYKVESTQEDIGESALVPYCVLEYLPNQVLVGTDAGIFIVDPTNVLAPFAVTGVVRVGTSDEDNPVYDLKILLDGQLFAVTLDGIYTLTPSGATFTSTENAGDGLSGTLHVISAMNNLLTVGSSDGIFYSDSTSDYETWYKASLVDSSNVEQEAGSCVTIIESSGVMFAGIENSFYSSVNGKTWTKRCEFSQVDGQDVAILKLGSFAEQTFALTSKGLYTDNGSSKSNTVVFAKSSLFDVIIAQFPDAATTGKYKTYVGDLYVASDSMHVVGAVPYAYKLQNGSWTYESLGADSAHKIFVTSLGRRMAVVGNIILVE